MRYLEEKDEVREIEDEEKKKKNTVKDLNYKTIIRNYLNETLQVRERTREKNNLKRQGIRAKIGKITAFQEPEGPHV